MALRESTEDPHEKTKLIEAEDDNLVAYKEGKSGDETQITLLEISHLHDPNNDNEDISFTASKDEQNVLSKVLSDDVDTPQTPLIDGEQERELNKEAKQEDSTHCEEEGVQPIVAGKSDKTPEQSSVYVSQERSEETNIENSSLFDAGKSELLKPDENTAEANKSTSEVNGSDKGSKSRSDSKGKTTHLQLPHSNEKIGKGKKKPKKQKVFSLTSPSNLSPTSPSSHKEDRKPKAINVAVFVKEGSAKLLMLERGKQTLAEEIRGIMIDTLGLPSIASSVFAVWLVSPFLEIQLKDHHVPFGLRKQWPDLLRKFTFVTDDYAIEQDEPVLLFQRNAFLSIEAEKRITDDKILKMLYEEAKHNVLKGKYPVPNSDGEMLGGYVARLEHGKFDPDCHKVGYFKNYLPSYLPQSCRGKWFTRSVSVEQRLLDQFGKASERVDDPVKLHRLFLEYCWTLPFYGCTFFKGKVEQQSKINDYWPWKGTVFTVFIGITRQGITIFKENRKEILMTLPYDDLSWDYVPSRQEGVHDSFCIEFDTVDDTGRRLAKQLQIFSPQSMMMDAMVDSCVDEMNRLKIPKSPTSPMDGDGNRLLADEGPSFLMRDRKSNFSLTSPFKSFSSH